MRKLYVGYGLLRAEYADELLLDQPARHAAERHHGQRREDRQASQIADGDDHRDSDNRCRGLKPVRRDHDYLNPSGPVRESQLRSLPEGSRRILRRFGSGPERGLREEEAEARDRSGRADVQLPSQFDVHHERTGSVHFRQYVSRGRSRIHRGSGDADRGIPEAEDPRNEEQKRRLHHAGVPQAALRARGAERQRGF